MSDSILMIGFRVQGLGLVVSIYLTKDEQLSVP